MLRIFKTEQEFDTFYSESLQDNRPQRIGFVPTMGNLHQGHISLLEKALEDNDIAVISIYVNPTQFGADEDLGDYPRTWSEDLQKIEFTARNYSNKNVIVFYPESDRVIYPKGQNISYSHKRLRNILEGQVRATHFDGVTTVVKRLFEIIRPHNAYFGKKDYQQQVIIKDMVKDLGMPISIITMPIVREESGLAMSSRNNYLSTDEKQKAVTLSKTLKHIATLLPNGIEHALKYIEIQIKNDTHWNYLEIRNKDLTLDLKDSNELVILGNYQLGSTRLLDNLEVEIK